MALPPAAARWSEFIERQEASGVTLGEFARANGLNRNTLAWWRWKLRRGRARPSPKGPHCALQSFVELAVVEPAAEPVSIVLDGLPARVVIHRHTDLALVRRVLEALC